MSSRYPKKFLKSVGLLIPSLRFAGDTDSRHRSRENNGEMKSVVIAIISVTICTFLTIGCVHCCVPDLWFRVKHALKRCCKKYKAWNCSDCGHANAEEVVDCVNCTHAYCKQRKVYYISEGRGIQFVLGTFMN
eukprot:TRINITY_DN1153_c0_g1_i1.p1 TRINITY_DN1153_c0_g1~~TRINITY_DN1153_c0_g1_i1.p1  ORF type:complete len:133 (+),score=9.05 TRINITY_DN1153_c0_g1_i1:845-1243(+)